MPALLTRKLWSREVRRPSKHGRAQAEHSWTCKPNQTHVLFNSIPSYPSLTSFVPRLEGQVSREATRINGGFLAENTGLESVT